MKTYVAKPQTVEKKWVLIDAKDMVLGRLASVIALRLRGKHKATFTPHVDTGDNIVVINAKHVKLTGNKRDGEKFYWHTGYAGGIKERTHGQILDGKYPERVLMKAVQRMLPEGPMGDRVLTNLRVFPEGEHTHEAQKPELLDVAAMNPKNKR
jgi:large subunit ribosomal protein L13